MRKFKYILPVAIALASASCNKATFDINSNPNLPTSLPISKILPTVEKNLGSALAIGSGISQNLEPTIHRITTREAPNGYNIQPTDGYIAAMWNTIYVSVLSNDEIIISSGTAGGNLRYVGIAKVIKAYALSQLVDVFGDVPFSEANKLKTPIINPKFDDDAAIYPQLLTLLDDAIANLNGAAGTLVPGADDVIYGGVASKWIKAANTLKLKLYTQERKVKNVSTEVNALITANNLITQTSESFLLPYGKSSAPDDRNPGFADYYATQRSENVSPWFYEIMKGYNPNIFTNNADPRIPYYIFNQIKLGQVAPNDANQTEYRDSSFTSLYFGSTGNDNGRSQQNTQSLLGIYPVGGRYDDGLGKGSGINQTSGTGAAPYRFITYADRLYLEAELINTGVVTGDARAKLLAAINESFKQVDYVITTYVKPSDANPPQTVPALVGRPAVTTYITNVMAEYDANPSRQLQIIMTQKWISSFGSAVDAYTDYRRTGFPILFNPSDPTMAPGGKVQPPINGDPVNPGAQKAVPVQLLKPFPLSLYWPQGELETNSSAPPQKEPSTYKVFWMP